MSKKSTKEMEDLYNRYNDFFYDLLFLKEKFIIMSKNVKGLCIEERFDKYTSKMNEIMEECDKQRSMWKEQLQGKRNKLEVKGVKDKVKS